MRLLPLLMMIALAGCQSPGPAPVSPPIAEKAPVPPPAAPAPRERDPNERRQAQLIEALINQNEALTQRLASTRSVPLQVPEVRTQRTPPQTAAKPFLLPNLEGFVDLRAPEGKSDEPVNPFDVPRGSDGKGREVTFTVSGIIAGAETCAVINDRTVQAGDVVETLTVETIARDAVFLALGERRLKLSVSETPVRVRLPE